MANRATVHSSHNALLYIVLVLHCLAEPEAAIRRIFFILVSLCALLGANSITSAEALPTATRVVVHKAERRMELLRGNEVLRTFKVSLGLVPRGHKERSGDFRTPEGRYQLTRRNARSDFFLSIQVSYPNDRDRRHARANGWNPGGAIMIHGLPNQLKREPDYYSRDWTDGCIAVSNSDMIEIWLLTHNNTPIDILP
jgi:murein L,D-transpeptidase YafK